jgi:hypothetical protein
LSEYQAPEALSWLSSNKNPSALAGNFFQTTSSAIEAVKRLYSAGATEVRIAPPLEEPERIQRDGGPYSDGLDIFFPKDKASQVMAVVKSLHADMGGRMKDIIKEGGSWRVILWWD